ncbi:MAG: LysM peptidoglycan-binding domain-containing protein [Gammaproteobacteria bacterium]|nr:LysM peptidoglycan-binding domain-containing protein [Gammaproteobacteria bacterium]
MSHIVKRQCTKGWITLSSLLLVTACANEKPPFSIVVEPTKASETKTVKAKIPEQSPTDTIVPEQSPTDTITYEAESPDDYIVQEGDTLWDISSVFLRDPWHWPEIWYKNPQVENPHLIYPGDVLAIIYIGGQKRVHIERRGEDGKILSSGTTGLKIIKMSPRVRTKSIDASIPSIPIDSIRHMLERPLVMDAKELDKSAYIISSVDSHLINSINNKLYVRKLNTTTGNGRYQIYRPNRPLHDPSTGELLGYEALFVGDGKLLLGGDPASVQVTNSEREILRNDRVLPVDNTNFERDFFPKPPATDVSGRIVSLFDAISQIGQYQTLAINLGFRDGLETGNVLDIKRTGVIIPDNEEEDPTFRVKLPDEKVGVAMIVRSFEKMSYALVITADQPISIEDYVESP